MSHQTTTANHPTWQAAQNQIKRAPTPPTTVILGAGFTGLLTALHLSRQQYPGSVVLIDRCDRFSFQPLLYDMLSQEMTQQQVHPRYAELLGSQVAFVQGTVETINLIERRVKLADGTTYAYDNLVLALGSVVNHFGVEGAREYSLPFRTGQDAIALAQQLRQRLQQARQEPDESTRRRLLTVALVGAGAVGIELAATLADLLPDWYSQLGGNPEELRLILLNRDQQILQDDINRSVHDTAIAALQQRRLAVELRCGYTVTAVGPAELTCQHHNQTEKLPAATVVWAAGVAAHPLIQALPVSAASRDRTGRLLVTPTLQLPDFPEVWAAGDCAVVEDQPLPMLAQVAYQEGKVIAENLIALATNQPLTPAQVNLRGSLLKLGVGEAAANLFGRVEVTGKLGHLVRQGTYLELLPTPQRNLKITVEWLTDELFQRHSPPEPVESGARQ